MKHLLMVQVFHSAVVFSREGGEDGGCFYVWPRRIALAAK